MRNVIVTGGSRGLGLGICVKLAASGFRVIAIARNRTDALAAAAGEAERAGAGAIEFLAFDLGAVEELPERVKQIRKDHGPIFGLVNNAGISLDGPLAMMPVSHIEQLLRINALAPMVLTRSVVRGMMAEGGGRIVNIASVTAFAGYSGLSVYSATKASLIGFTRSLAREVGRIGVTVNSVAPGFIETDLTRGLTDDQRQRIERRSALKRFADVEDVANAVDFLLSEGAKNITGTVLTVDAGNTA